jgi:CRP/FNR family transcriptional regulator, dissimilatory nitrate respiration regulator
LHSLESGSAKIFCLSPQGRPYILCILEEGDTFAEVPAFDGGLKPVNVEALETSRAWVINGEKLRALVTLSPLLLKKSWRISGRCCAIWCAMPVRWPSTRINEQQSDGSPPQWTQEQLAAQLGTVREVVARSLKELERSGAIRIDDRRIHVADQNVL